MIQNIDTKTIKPTSKTKMLKDVAETKQSSRLNIQAYKTNDLYKLPTEDCHRLLTENITKTNKKITPSAINAINRKAKKTAQDLKKRQSFVTLKEPQRELSE